MQLRRKHFIWSLVAVTIIGISGEIFARYYLGLGTPPLSITHPKIDYMFKPNQDLYRFGNHIIINQYGMRTTPFTEKKGNGEFRIMVFGDSVINGGSQTDQTELATTILQERLSKTKKVVVGNISAGGWGPGNWLEYAKEYGFFGADIIVLVISSHDYYNNPSLQPLNKNTHPTEKPISALMEGITRYLPRYLPRLDSVETSSESNLPNNIANEKEIDKGLENLRNFLVLAKGKTTHILVFQHFEKKEIERGFPDPGNKRIKEVCESVGLSPVSLYPYFHRSIEIGENPYRDNVHPNQVGQRLIVNAILENMPK